MKTLYHYHPETGEYLASSFADADPLELKTARDAARSAIVEPARSVAEAAMLAASAANTDARSAAQEAYADTVSRIAGEGEAFEAARSAAAEERDASIAVADEVYEATAASIQTTYQNAVDEADAAAAAVEPTAWMMPAHSTEIVPPEAEEGEACIFADGGWTLTSDHRGKVFYAPDRTRHTIAELGIEPDPSWTEEEPAPTEEELWDIVRRDRGNRMGVALAVLERHRNQKEFGLATTLTDAAATAWAIYLQALRDIPEIQADPAAIEWPVEPAN
ncbi:MAG TPA: phage tail assembly chaperone [Novosphingobium sp.]|nr:phage tail assembly chaperone [Novosphingobium sp.]